MTAKKEADAAAGPLVYRAMIALMRDIDAIAKSKDNKQQGFKYRGIDQVYNEIHPLLCKHGIFMTGEVCSAEREERQTQKGGFLIYSTIKMRYHFIAEDSSSVSTEAYGEGMDSGDKASNKAMAVAHKYALFQAFCIPTEDMPDPDAEAHEVAPKQPESLPDVDESTVIRLTQAFDGARTLEDIQAIWDRCKADRDALKAKNPSWFDEVSKAASSRKKQLSQKKEAQ